MAHPGSRPDLSASAEMLDPDPDRMRDARERFLAGVRGAQEVPVLKPWLCQGCTGCAAACESQALTVARAPGCIMWVVDYARCNGCGACATACHGEAIALHPELRGSLGRGACTIVAA